MSRRFEALMPASAPTAFGKNLRLVATGLIRRDMPPPREIGWSGAVMGHIDNGHAPFTRQLHDGQHVRNRTDPVHHRLGMRMNLAARRQEIIVGIDQQDGGVRPGINKTGHDDAPDD